MENGNQIHHSSKIHPQSYNSLLFIILVIFVAGSLLIWTAAVMEYLFLSQKKEKTEDVKQRINFLVLIIIGTSFFALSYLIQFYLFVNHHEIIVRTSDNTGFEISE